MTAEEEKQETIDRLVAIYAQSDDATKWQLYNRALALISAPTLELVGERNDGLNDAVG